jgi:hypothetical protein
VNAIPAAGVVLTLVLLAIAWPRSTTATPHLRGDRARLVLAVLLAVGAVPYVFADLGFYAPDPLLADEPTPGEDIAAIHLGSHEGMDGALLAFAALALSRLTPWFRAGGSQRRPRPCLPSCSPTAWRSSSPTTGSSRS